jgi:teichoic acid transport system permease protein
VEETDFGAIARSAGLERVGSRPPLLTYIKQVWERRAFALTLAQYRIQSANEQNRLGLAWVVIRPILNAVVYGLIFGVLLKTAPDPALGPVPQFIPYLIVGVFIFEYFSDAFSDGSKSIVRNAQLVKSLSFPRILLPIASVLQSLFELLPMIVVMLGIVLLSGEPVTAAWLMVIPILALMTLFNAGVAFIAARLTVHFQDFSQIVPFITRLMFYGTGIFFSLEQFLKPYPTILFIARLNPVHDYIALARGVLVRNSEIVPLHWIVAIVGAFVVFIAGFIYFWKAEEQYGRD